MLGCSGQGANDINPTFEYNLITSKPSNHKLDYIQG